MKPKLKFGHRMLILIGIPVIFQVFSVAGLSIALLRLENIYQLETHARDAVNVLNEVLVNLLAGSWQAIAQIGAASTGMQVDASMALEGQKTVDDIERARRKMRQFARKDKSGIGVDKLVEFDQLLEYVPVSWRKGADAFVRRDPLAAVAALDGAYGVTHRGVKLSRELSLEFDQLHDEQRRIHDREIGGILTVVYSALVLNVAGTVVLMLSFLKLVSRRFDALSENISLLGMDRPLNRTAGGEDEFAQLESILFRVSNEINALRHKEQAVINNAVDMICTLTPQLRFAQVNPAWCNALGAGEDDLLGMSVVATLPEEDRNRTASALEKAIAEGTTATLENRIKSANGTLLDASWTVRWAPEEANLFCVVHDVTQRKQAERMKQEVMAIVSHDLRSPLTSLQMTIDLLLSGALGNLSDKALQRLQRAHVSTEQLINLTNDLLEMDKLESGVFLLSKEKLTSQSVVDKAIALIESHARANNVEIDLQMADIEFTADENRIVRALVNLLSNAIKFSAAGSRVTVRSSRENGYARFAVIDSGPGIAPEHIDQIFDRYRQVSRDDETKRKGAGLGLAITKALVEAHDGKIGVESEPGKGSCFWIMVPA